MLVSIRKYFFINLSTILILANIERKYISVLKNAFDTFDVEKKGSIGTVMIGTILSMLGIQTTDKMLQEIINEVDADGKSLLQYELMHTKKIQKNYKINHL